MNGDRDSVLSCILTHSFYPDTKWAMLLTKSEKFVHFPFPWATNQFSMYPESDWITIPDKVPGTVGSHDGFHVGGISIVISQLTETLLDPLQRMKALNNFPAKTVRLGVDHVSIKEWVSHCDEGKTEYTWDIGFPYVWFFLICWYIANLRSKMTGMIFSSRRLRHLVIWPSTSLLETVSKDSIDRERWRWSYSSARSVSLGVHPSGSWLGSVIGSSRDPHILGGSRIWPTTGGPERSSLSPCLRMSFASAT